MGALGVTLPYDKEGQYEREVKFFGIAASLVGHALRAHRLLEGERKRLGQEKRREKADQARLSRNSQFILDPQSGHHIQLDHPELVIVKRSTMDLFFVAAHPRTPLAERQVTVALLHVSRLEAISGTVARADGA